CGNSCGLAQRDSRAHGVRLAIERHRRVDAQTAIAGFETPPAVSERNQRRAAAVRAPGHLQRDRGKRAQELRPERGPRVGELRWATEYFRDEAARELGGELEV